MLPTSGGFADAVIVAAGASSRMGGTDKSQAPIAGRPALRWAVDAMRARHRRPAHHRGHCPRTAGRPAGCVLDAEADVLVVTGGARRQDSVARGVRLADAEVVLVHDAARPLATAALVDRVAEAAAIHGAAIPVMPVPDSLKLVANGRVTGTADRSTLFRAQTPQGARRELLLAAVDAWADGPEPFGDEQEMLARNGVPVVTVAGESAALKITESADLDVVRALARTTGTRRIRRPPDALCLGHRQPSLRQPRRPATGWPGHARGAPAAWSLRRRCRAARHLRRAPGRGSHGRPGPSIPGERCRDPGHRQPRPAARGRGTGERGGHPAGVPGPDHHGRPAPPGGARLDRMRAIVAGLLGLEPGAVAVQASSGNLSGDEGAGRTISASALVGVWSA